MELSIEPKPIHEASSDPLRVPQELREGSHPIWDYLASSPLTNQHLVIIGPPGSGKTTLLKHITLCLVAQRRRQQAHRRSKIPYKLPIVLFLRDHVEKFTGEERYSLIDALHDHLKKWEQPLPPTNWVKRRLGGGRCMVMLDGLDEIANLQARQAVVNWVQRQMIAYPMNRFIITSRPFGYRSNPLSGVTVLEVRPFTTEQIEHFVYNWYLANEMMSKQLDDPGVRMKAKASARDLLQRLRTTPALYALALNPLLLTMITTVHRYRGSLPGKRVTLYTEICEVFLGKRQEARGQKVELTPAQMQLALQPLAYHLMLSGKRDIALDEAQAVIAGPLASVSTELAPEDFLRLVEQVSGLLLERESGIYSFAHLTFQEYLAAVQIQAEALEQILVAHVEESWWQETVRLYCAQADASPIIAACLVGSSPSVPKLTLAIECQQEAQRVQPVVKAQLDALLNQGVEDPDPEKQHIVAEALLMRRLRQMVQLKEETYVDTSLITCAEYQVFLDEQRALNIFYQPDHWNDYHFSLGWGHAPALGVRQTDANAFCGWLTARENGPWRYRLPKEGELEQEAIKRVLDGFTAGFGYWLDERKGFIRVKETPLKEANFIREYVNTTFARAITHTRDLALSRDLSHYRDIDLDRAINHAIDLVFAIARDLARPLDLTRPLNLFHADEVDRAVTLILDRVISHFRSRVIDLSRYRDIDLFRPLDLAYILSRDRDLSRDLAFSIDIYIDLAVLKGRREGKLLAYEGILLVKEQKQDNSTASRGLPTN